MRCIIARYPFDLTKPDVEAAMKGIKPELVTTDSVRIGRRTYPVKQVGEVVTRQDRRDFTAEEMTRALTRLGFTCGAAVATPVSEAAAASPTPFQAASAMLGNHPPQ